VADMAGIIGHAPTPGQLQPVPAGDKSGVVRALRPLQPLDHQTLHRIRRPVHEVVQLLALGRGEILQRSPVNLSGYRLALIHPGIHVNTGWAFERLNRKESTPSASSTLAGILQLPPTQWKDNLHNDFEEPVFEAHPSLKAIKDDLYAKGAVYAAMSGSGSTIFGIFEKSTKSLVAGGDWHILDL